MFVLNEFICDYKEFNVYEFLYEAKQFEFDIYKKMVDQDVSVLTGNTINEGAIGDITGKIVKYFKMLISGVRKMKAKIQQKIRDAKTVKSLKSNKEINNDIVNTAIAKNNIKSIRAFLKGSLSEGIDNENGKIKYDKLLSYVLAKGIKKDDIFESHQDNGFMTKDKDKWNMNYIYDFLGQLGNGIAFSQESINHMKEVISYITSDSYKDSKLDVVDKINDYISDYNMHCSKLNVSTDNATLDGCIKFMDETFPEMKELLEKINKVSDKSIDHQTVVKMLDKSEKILSDFLRDVENGKEVNKKEQECLTKFNSQIMTISGQIANKIS